MSENCQRCKSPRVAFLSGKSSDMNTAKIAEHVHHGYVPYDFGAGGGDYFKMHWCLDCGQVQGTFPVKQTALERGEKEE